MADQRPSIWESMQLKGYSRRDFIKYCNFALGVAGLEAVGLNAVVRAFETKPRPAVVIQNIRLERLLYNGYSHREAVATLASRDDVSESERELEQLLGSE